MSDNAVLDEQAQEMEDGALLLVKMQCPQNVDGHFWSELLVDAGALYVSMSDANRGTDVEEAIYHAHPPDASSAQLLESTTAEYTTGHLTPVWSNSILEVGFAPDVDVEATLLLAAAVAGESPPRFEVEVLGARDWVAQVQQEWTPVELAGCLRILFPWHNSEQGHALTELRLQPGMAFGTGEHATTQLCCRAVHELLTSRLSGCPAILDYGSGSGVLAFTALLFGCKRAVGVEIDPYALKVSRANAVDNGMQDRFVAYLPSEEPSEQYDLIVANILARTLVQLEDILASRAAPEATILLSGIWGDEQVALVQKAFAEHFDEFETSWQDGWALVSAKRKMQ